MVSSREGWTAENLEARQKEVRAATLAKGQHNSGNGFGLSLGAAATQWQTPVSDDHVNREKGKINSRGEPKLSAQALQWPTPASRDWKGENGEAHLTNGTGRLHMDQLPNAVAHAFTRPDPVITPHGPKLSQLRPIWRPLRVLLIASHGRATWRRLWKGRSRRRLNPLFVEWLMGWPSGHALCGCSEMEFTLWQRDMRGALSQQPTASGLWIWRPPAETASPQTQMILL